MLAEMGAGDERAAISLVQLLVTVSGMSVLGCRLAAEIQHHPGFSENARAYAVHMKQLIKYDEDCARLPDPPDLMARFAASVPSSFETTWDEVPPPLPSDYAFKGDFDILEVDVEEQIRLFNNFISII
ncbi:hypothetical protein FOA52_012824 [Chlamydomonas sp. UWO 241]|nr:hypothetical protein FOA52_012824 [Chlamydomonas sp. UWO 241]